MNAERAWRNAPGKNGRAVIVLLVRQASSPFLSVAIVHGVHDGYHCRDKVLSIFGSFVACTGTASDLSGRFIYALDWSDGGGRGECQ